MGIHESTIMKIGGWKTRSMFDRYNITDEADLADASRRMDQRHLQLIQDQTEHAQELAKEAETMQNGHSSGIANKKSDKIVNTQLPN
jgi:hypothetical protein